MSDGHKYRVLFVTSEVQPLMKTGGLADVSASLPAALRARGHDVRILTPAYADSLTRGFDIRPQHRFLPPPGMRKMKLLETVLPEYGVPSWLLDMPAFSARSGSPYVDARGLPYPDNAECFNSLCRVAAWIAAGNAGLGWQPELVHCNEWHTGLVPVWLGLDDIPVASVFTIHNLAYQGLFPRDDFEQLQLPASLWHHQALEFHNHVSFIKGGLQFADRLTTVSPTFAREILLPENGEGLDGVLRERSAELTGILNGLDTRCWNPEDDPLLTQNYSFDSLQFKSVNKLSVQRQLQLEETRKLPLVAVIGRLAYQKGIDVLLDALPELMELPLQLAIIGSGDLPYEAALLDAAQRYPRRMAVHLGFNEALAHRLEAGADILLMPSRFEPCGLTQMQSLRYGTVPVVGRCGGLIDTVTETDPISLNNQTATGFFIDPLSPENIVATMRKVLDAYRRPDEWRALMGQGMRQDFSWDRSARNYETVYHAAMADRRDGSRVRRYLSEISTPPGSPQG